MSKCTVLRSLLNKSCLFLLGSLLAYSCTINEADTVLKVTVRDFNSGAVVQGASVILYKNSSDWTYSNNSYRSTNTDATGVATFVGVDSNIDYYFDALQGIKTNSNFAINVGSPIKQGTTATVSTFIK